MRVRMKLNTRNELSTMIRIRIRKISVAYKVGNFNKDKDKENLCCRCGG